MDAIARRRVVNLPICSTWDGSGTLTLNAADCSGLAQHQITVACSAKPSAGVLQVSVRPPGARFYVPAASLDLTINGSGTLLLPALLDGIALSFSTSLSGGTVAAALASAGNSFLPSDIDQNDPISRRRLIISAINSWIPSGSLSVPATDHSGLAQHQISLTGGVGVLQLLGRHPQSGVYVSVSSSTDALDASGALAIFSGIYDSFQLIPVGPVTGTVVGQLASIGTSLFYQSLILSAKDIGLGNVDNTSDVNKPVSTAQQTALDALIQPGYIDGFQMKWVSGTALTLSSGAAYIEGSADVLQSASDIAKTGLSLSANTWYHVYPYDNAGAPDFVLSTTAPAAPYNGTARSMTGDSSKRYRGSVLTDASGNIKKFYHHHKLNYVQYQTDVIPQVILNAGTATSSTSVSASPYVPVTARIAKLLGFNSSSDSFMFISNSDGPAVPTGYLAACAPKQAYLAFDCLLNSSQALVYAFNSTPSAGAGFLRVMGYQFEC